MLHSSFISRLWSIHCHLRLSDCFLPTALLNLRLILTAYVYCIAGGWQTAFVDSAFTYQVEPLKLAAHSPGLLQGILETAVPPYSGHVLCTADVCTFSPKA